jgi:hypothetical protein
MKTRGTQLKEVDSFTSVDYSPFVSREDASRSIVIWMMALLAMLLTGVTMFVISFRTMPEHGKLISTLTFMLTTGFALYKIWRAERVLYRTRPNASAQ